MRNVSKIQRERIERPDFPKEEGRINVTETIIANKEENLPDL